MNATEIYNAVEGVFYLIVQYAILITELVGVCVLILTIVKAVIGMARRKQRLRLDLAEGIALALEFKMGGELLRTVVVREWKELLILGAVILLRAAMTFLIQWEIRVEKRAGEPESPVASASRNNGEGSEEQGKSK